MQWFRAHPYTSAVAVAAFVILVGAFIVKERAAVSPNSSSVIAWGGSGSYWYPTLGERTADSAPQHDATGLYREIQNYPPFSYTPYVTKGAPEMTQDDFDLETLIALLSRPAQNDIPHEDGGTFLSDVYSFIPSGLIAITTSEQPAQTPTQQALYRYGNDVGVIVRTFEEQNRNMARVLQDQFNDPRNPQKNASLIALADGMLETGRSLEILEGVPSSATSANTRLSESYKEMGAMLALIPEAELDEERLNAMLAYNAAADEYIKNVISLATLFSAADVKFKSADSGSVFTFTAVSF